MPSASVFREPLAAASSLSRHGGTETILLRKNVGGASAPQSAPQTAAVSDTTVTAEQDAAPSGSATPVPESPRKLDWATFVASPNLWPKMVVLTTPVSFPVVLLNGRVAGLARMPAGTPVKFDGVVGNKLKIEYQGGVQTVSVSATDLEQRLLVSSVAK